MFSLFIKGCHCSKPACFNYRIKALNPSSRWQNSWAGASFCLQLGGGGTQSTGSSQHQCNTCAQQPRLAPLIPAVAPALRRQGPNSEFNQQTAEDAAGGRRRQRRSELSAATKWCTFACLEPREAPGTGREHQRWGGDLPSGTLLVYSEPAGDQEGHESFIKRV